MLIILYLNEFEVRHLIIIIVRILNALVTTESASTESASTESASIESASIESASTRDFEYEIKLNDSISKISH